MERRIAREFGLSRREAADVVESVGGRGRRVEFLPVTAAAATLLVGVPMLILAVGGLADLVAVPLVGDIWAETVSVMSRVAALGAGLLLASEAYDLAQFPGLRRRLREAADRAECAHCGYSLAGVPAPSPGTGPVCPECGREAVLRRGRAPVLPR